MSADWPFRSAAARSSPASSESLPIRSRAGSRDSPRSRHPSDVKTNDREREFIRPYRFVGVALVVAFLMSVLVVRLWDLQVVQGERYRTLAEGNRLLRLPVPADRGIILDRSGKILVRNIPGFAVSVVPVDLPAARQAGVAAGLAQLIGRD